MNISSKSRSFFARLFPSALLCLAPAGAVDLDISSRATVDTASFATGVALRENFAFIGDGLAGIQIFDISNPEHPLAVGNVDTPGWASGMAIADDLLFVADGVAGLRVLNIANRAAPSFVGVCKTGGEAWDVAVQDRYAYVAAGNAGLRIIDISDPERMEITGALDTTDARGVAVRDSFAYVADNGAGLRIIRIQNPLAPTQVSLYDSPGECLDVVVDGDHAFLADGGAGLAIVSVKNPAGPFLRAQPLPKNTRASAVALQHHRVLVAGSSLDIVEMSQPNQWKGVGRFRVQDSAFGIASHNQRVFLATRLRGIQVVDLALANPQTFGAATETQSLAALAYLNQKLYAAGGTEGLVVFNTQDLEHPIVIAKTNTTGKPAVDVKLANHLAYVLFNRSSEHNDSLLQLYDMAGPGNPASLRTIHLSNAAHRLIVRERYCFIATDTGLQIVEDIPTTPIWRQYYTPQPITCMALSGSYIHLGQAGGFDTLNVDSVPAFTPVGRFWNSAIATVDAIVIEGGFASLLARESLSAPGSLLVIVDARDPTAPMEVAAVPLKAVGTDLWIDANRLYVALGQYGFEIYDIADPAQPRKIGGNSGRNATILTVNENNVFTAGAGSGLTVFNRFYDGSLEFSSLSSDSQELRFSVSGPPGWPVRIESSSDLLDWDTWTEATLTAPALEWRAPVAGPALFFRAAQNPEL